MGACIQCSNKTCYQAFHVTCARKCRLQLKMKNTHGGMVDLNTLKGYCDKHVPTEWRQEHDVDGYTARAKDYYRREFKNYQWADSQQSALSTERALQGQSDMDAEKDEDPLITTASDSNKKALLKKIWRLPSGAPIVPHLVYKNVDAVFARYQIIKRREFLAETCKYWTLKREARRGASLLKRLQLQLELFSSMEMTRRNFAAMGAAGGPKLKSRIEFAEALEGDIEQIRVLCEKTHERELLKIKDVELMRDIVDKVYFPIVPLLWPILEKALSLDSSYNYFQSRLQPVQKRLEQRYYISVAVFTSDFGQAINDSVYTSDVEEPLKPVSEQLNAVVERAKHKDLQKDKISRAKRTLKAVTADLIEAAGREADLISKPREEFQNSVSLILEHALDPPANLPTRTTEAPSDVGADATGNRSSVNGDGHTGTELKINGIHTEDVAMRDIDDATPKNDLSLPNGTSISLTNGVLSLSREEHEEQPQTRSARETPNSNLPALSTGSSNRTASVHEPLTPPTGDNKESSSTFEGTGGIPWYLEAFEPNGTTIHEPPEDVGKDNHAAIRSNSEELSDMDEDAVNGLVESVERQDFQTPAVLVKKKGGKQKRRR
jgi:NuA3 HAT complex component NTO1